MMSAVTERAFFFGDPAQPLFGVGYQPVPELCRNLGWAICPPFAAERPFAQRFQVQLARSLARRGYPVLRFDYRGTGDSFGRFSEFDLEHYRQDLQTALRALQQDFGVGRVGVIGLRLGASFAYEIACRCSTLDPVILMEPVLQGGAYLREIRRCALTQQLPSGGAEAASVPAGSPEGLNYWGYDITPEQQQSLKPIDLCTLRLDGARNLALLSFCPAADTPSNPRLLEFLKAVSASAAVERFALPLDPVWRPNRRLVEDYQTNLSPLLDLVDGVYQPLRNGNGVLGKRPEIRKPAEDAADRRPLSAPAPGAGAPLPEEPVCFPVNGEARWGILHLPAPGVPLAGAIAMTAPGYICRTMSNRTYVKIARLLQQQGWMVLRYDPRGIGDSQGTLNFSSDVELFQAIQKGLFVPDARAAIQCLRERAAVSEIVLLSFCGGGVTDILTAAQDAGVKRVIAVDYPFSYSLVSESLRSVYLFRKSVEKLVVSRMKNRDLYESLRRCYRWVKRDGLQRLRELSHRLNLFGGRKISGRARQRLLEKIGASANDCLFAAFQACLEKCIPIVSIFSDSMNYWEYKQAENILAAEQQDWHRLLRSCYIENSNHIFSHPHNFEQLMDVIQKSLNPGDVICQELRCGSSCFENPPGA